MPGPAARLNPPKSKLTTQRERNLQGWAVDQEHPLHSSLTEGAVWTFITVHAGALSSPECRAAFSYLAANAGAVLSSHPPETSQTKLLQTLLELPAISCPEDVLLDAVLSHIAAVHGFSSTTTAEWSSIERIRAVATIRALISSIKMGSLSVRAVLRAIEPLQIVSDEELLTFYRAAALGEHRKDVRGALRVVEGEHPYSHDDNGTVDEIHMNSGCTSVLVEFDKRCEILNGADLVFFADAEGKREISRWSSGWTWRGTGIRYLVVDFPLFYVEFRCAEGVATGWGWKMQVTPLEFGTEEEVD